jgi:hypothetical protein
MVSIGYNNYLGLNIPATGDLRVKLTGKNGSSSHYKIRLSRLEIIRTG